MAVLEGHAEHVMDAVGADARCPSLPRLRAAMTRRRARPRPPARLLQRLLGLEMKMRQYQSGKRSATAWWNAWAGRSGPGVGLARGDADARRAGGSGRLDGTNRRSVCHKVRRLTPRLTPDFAAWAVTISLAGVYKHMFGDNLRSYREDYSIQGSSDSEGGDPPPRAPPRTSQSHTAAKKAAATRRANARRRSAAAKQAAATRAAQRAHAAPAGSGVTPSAPC